ncbi:MAG: TIGR02452 family protein [Chloroflexi bacterium]|nr:TIGR02452 family protein [Chloroflexota bacterium]
MRKNLTLDLAPITHDEFHLPANVVTAIHNATQSILARGSYTNPAGVDMSIRAMQDAARNQQVRYSPADQIPAPTGRYSHTHLYVYNQASLTVAQERVRQGYRVAVLAFANPTLNSAHTRRASISQEHSIHRATSIQYCTLHQDWLKDAAQQSPLYDDTVVVTPLVPVFREQTGDLLGSPYACGFVHAIAVDAHAVRRTMPEREAEIPNLMLQRAQRVLRAVAMTRANVLVLGAWGCGGAGIDASVMAAIWQVAIEQSGIRTFGIIDFAVPDVSSTQATYLNFYRRLHQRLIDLP